MHVAFGKAYRSGSVQDGAGANDEPPSARSRMSVQNMERFDRRHGGGSQIGYKRPVDPEVVVFTGEEGKSTA